MAPLRFSLKWLMVGVAIAAISCAALASASAAWATAIITSICVALFAATLLAALGTGRGRAFAIGFAIGTLFYLLSWQASRRYWFALEEPDLLTDRIVDRLYDLIKHEAPATSPAAGGAPAAGTSGAMMGGGMMPGGAAGPMGMGGGGMGSTAGFFPRGGPTFLPDQNQFLKIAHWLIAFYFGLAGGWFGIRLRDSQSIA